jgi:hypothetical protein
VFEVSCRYGSAYCSDFSFLPKDTFDHIKVLMDDGFDLILLIGNSAISRQVIYESFWAAKIVYLECILGSIWSLLMNMGLSHIGSKVGLS